MCNREESVWVSRASDGPAICFQLKATSTPSVSVDAPAPGQMTITSLQGQMIAERKVTTIGNETINVKHFPAGTYISQLTTEKAVYLTKIVKM